MGPLKSFFQGASYPAKAFVFVKKNRLWSWALAPTVVNVLLLLAFVIVAISWLAPLVNSLTNFAVPSYVPDFLQNVVLFFAKALAWILWILIPILVLGVGIILFVLLGQAIASPFLDILSEKIEVMLLGQEPVPTTLSSLTRSVVIAIGDVFWTLVYFVVLNIPLLLMHLVPIIGTAIAAGIGFCITALLLAQEFAGLPLARQLVPFPRRFKWIWRHRWLALGFGCSVFVLFFVPGLNLVFLPMASVGGTLLYCDVTRTNENVPSVVVKKK